MVLKFAFKHQEGRKIIPSTRKGGFPITKKGGIISKHQEGRNYIQAPRREEGRKYFPSPRREELYQTTKKGGGEKVYPITKKRGIISKHHSLLVTKRVR